MQNTSKSCGFTRASGRRGLSNDSVPISNDTQGSSDSTLASMEPTLKGRVMPNKSAPASNPSRERSTTTKRVLGNRPVANVSRNSRAMRRNPVPTWSIPGHPDWDVIKVLQSDECLAPDRLLELPKPNHTYISKAGKLKDPNRYAWGQVLPPRHPKIEALIKSGNYKRVHESYYQNMPRDVNIPTAGIPRDRPEPLSRSASSCDSEDEDGHHTLNLPSLSHTANYVTTNNENQEESFHAKPAVKLIIPDHIKAILVDDWENVTKNLQLVPLPAAKPANLILNDYLQYEKPRRQPGSAQADILDEVVAGLKEYFEKCLGRILLYR